MAIIYRVERENGGGMYYTNSDDITFEMQDSMRHPPPHKDAKLKKAWGKLCDGDWSYKSSWSFGFSTIEQLKNWIYQTEWREILTNLEYYVVSYNAKEYHFGDTQAIFRKETANRLEVKTLLEI